MAVRPAVIAVLCVGLFLLLQSLVPRAQGQSTSNINGFRLQDQRTHKRRNYMLQRARDRDILQSLDNAITYDTEGLDPSRNPEELSAFIEDYANMIDDVILLDKSVETRTRKRGNIKLEKNYNDQVIIDPPCTCNYSVELEYLGEDYFPRNVETRVCSKVQPRQGCVAPYMCMESKYDLKILKRKRTFGPGSPDLPRNLSTNWSVEIKPVSVGCICSRDYVTNITS